MGVTNRLESRWGKLCGEPKGSPRKGDRMSRLEKRVSNILSLTLQYYGHTLFIEKRFVFVKVFEIRK